MRSKNTFSLAVIAFCAGLLTSCVIVTGLDPAEQLAEEIEAKSAELRRTEATTLEFDYIPSEYKVKKAPHYDGYVTLGVHVNKTDRGHSVIDVDSWFRTTYHNRFVWVDYSMKQTKGLGDPFRIVLKKSNGKIQWSAIN